ncbi:alpha-N-acetylglucosaminidase [Allobaculum mucilyticum]|nr:alpha-N-acetylglucosaminidase [Allobaculum mucilyticum]
MNGRLNSTGWPSTATTLFWISPDRKKSGDVFLGGLGYSDQEVCDWLVGPGYLGWMYMANVENISGPIPHDWFAKSTELARHNHRYMRAMGMTPVLQGYSGMVPTTINTKDSSVEIIDQGWWNGIQRPAMLKTNTATYDDYAARFYQAQKEVYGDWAHHYATDPFHEGGNTGGIGRDTVGWEVLDAMKKYDPNCTWVTQSWSFESDLLSWISAEEKQNNILLLDLDGTRNAKYDDTSEFSGSSWTYCMLENYGRRVGLCGNLKKIAQIPSRVKQGTSHMVGMGIAPEGTDNDPVKYDLWGEMMWESKDIDVNEWLKDYIKRRDEAVTENAIDAWKILLNTAYSDLEYFKTPPESIFCAMPQFDASKAAPNGSFDRHYNIAQFEGALTALMEDYDQFKDSEGYQYDVNTLLRQCVAISAYPVYTEFTSAYRSKNIEAFDKASEEFLDLLDLQAQVLNSNKASMLGTWLNPSIKAGEDEDDFTKRIYEMNARGLITTWAPYYTWGVYDYANREYGGLLEDYYGARWKAWIERLSNDIHGSQSGSVENMSSAESYRFAWDFCRNDTVYPTEPEGDVKALYSQFITNYSLNKPVDSLASYMYSIDPETRVISNVPASTSKSVFLSNVSRPDGSTLKIQRGSTVLGDDDLLEKDDSVILTLTDGSRLTYTIGDLVIPTDFSCLASLMRQAQNLIASDYENESWNEFEQTRTLVNVVYVNPEAFQAEVDAACTQLEEALNGLRLIPADTAALESLIEQTKALNPEDYVSFEDVQAILDSAKDGLPEKQSEVDAMKNSLQQALDALRRIDDPEQTLDYSLLETLCTKAETLDLGAFKQAGKDEFSAALQAGKNLVSHAQSQSQIDQAADTLHTSLLALRKTPSAASLGL